MKENEKHFNEELAKIKESIEDYSKVNTLS